MNLRKSKSVNERRKALEKEQNVDLSNISHFSLDKEVAGSRNCENMIGVAQIPMGVAGPLKIQSLKFKVQSYFIPLATTEGALVASVNRGCKAITDSGGALVNSHHIGTTRGPVFYTGGISQNQKLYDWLEKHETQLAKISEATSNHLRYKKHKITTLGKYAFVRFYYDTQDAMGMNMVTIATQKMVDYIQKHTGVSCLSVAGNFDIDKKPAWLNLINQRGIKVWAEVTIPEKIIKQVLKTTAKKIYDVWLAKCMLGSVMSGSMGFNAHYANVIAAMFIATGQDPAHVVEGSLGVTTTELVNGKDLYVSVYLPDLMVGTVGGGTGLATQKEALELLGVAGGNQGKNKQRLAEIVGATVLAGEISLLASLAEGSLAKAHQALARGNEKAFRS